ncbi:MAG: malectin domain-containing carbohydrate-binding protein, partial [Leeuwenhoekiella sp.]
LGPDVNYMEPAYDFGKNKSPNGVIEYKSDAFDGKLQGLLMVVRFSGQDDVMVLDPKSNGDIAEVYTNIPGLRKDAQTPFDDPLEIVEDPKTGNLYVSEYDRDNNRHARLTLLRAKIQATGTEEIVYTQQFNFQTPDNISISPENYADDLGKPYTTQQTPFGNVDFGWVEPGSSIPADASMNARNRNKGDTNDDPLLNTFTHLGHKKTNLYPTLDWLVKVPNGEYYVDISVGEPLYRDSYHKLDVNGVTVIDFDQQNANPQNLNNYQNVKLINVTDGFLRLSLAEGGVNTKLNFLRIAPVSTALLPPIISANFQGDSYEDDVYIDSVDVTVDVEDQSNSGEINLVYQLDDNAQQDYTGSLSISSLGSHRLMVTATDGNGNSSIETYNFEIQNSTGALLYVENMTKVPTTNRGFPADDYFTFHRVKQADQALVHDSNTLRINNTGTGDLIVSNIVISDLTKFTYTISSDNNETNVFPVTIKPGAYRDVKINFIGETEYGKGNKAIYIEEIKIVSNADNKFDNIATLHGTYMYKKEGGNEINAQQAIEAFGFKTSMLSIVNTEGTITPKNKKPYAPNSTYPTVENVEAGYEGDFVGSANFVQADPTKPIIGMHLAAFHGLSSDGARLIQVNGSGTVGGMDFKQNPYYYQTLLPEGNNGSYWSYDTVDNISGPFRIEAAYYPTSGTYNSEGKLVLGARVYKVIDHQGNIIPNEYIVIQDFVGNGCDSGGGNCDFNDNIFYFINIRPQSSPTVNKIEDHLVKTDTIFNYDIHTYFNKGYAGNELIYSARYDDAALPDWLTINAATGIITGVPPADLNEFSIPIQVLAKDLNNLQVSSTFNLLIDKDVIAVDDYENTFVNTSLELNNLLINDIEVNNNDLNIIAISQPSNGEVNLNSITNTVTYTPSKDFVGMDIISYTVANSNGISDKANVYITVLDQTASQGFELRINAGGPEITNNGKIFIADQYFEGGNDYTNVQATVSDIYQSERTSSSQYFDYNIPVEDGTYDVVLHFAEIYHGVSGGGEGGIGKRIFDVNIEDTVVLDNYDITKEVDADVETSKTFTVYVSDGILNIHFSAQSNLGGVDQPKLSALEILGTCNSLSAPWNNRDIGDVASMGSACYGNQTFTVNASGSDIWFNDDEFHYVYQTLSGDGEIIAQVSELENSDNWAKAGVMMRKSLNPQSASAQVIISPNPNNSGNFGYTYQFRKYDGSSMDGNSSNAVDIPAGIPYYVRLVRSGNIFKGYVSADKNDWTFIMQQEIQMEETIYVGLATTSHNDGVTTTASYRNVDIIKNTTRQLQINPKVLGLAQDKNSVAQVNISMYPNPASKQVNIHLSNSSSKLKKVNLYDLNGSLIRSYNAKSIQADDGYQFRVDYLQEGVYIVNLIFENGYFKHKRLVIGY